MLFVSDSIPQLEKCLCHILDYTPSQQYELIVVATKGCAEVHEYVSALHNIRLLPYRADMSVGARYKSVADFEKFLHLSDLKVDKDDLNTYQLVCLAKKVKG